MHEFGLMYFFKKFSHMNPLFQELSYSYRTSLYLAASASAEFIADVALCPMESVKVRVQTMPGFATTLREGFPKIAKDEGFNG
jgi:solute carrier family 25 phosphate transporter 3